MFMSRRMKHRLGWLGFTLPVAVLGLALGVLALGPDWWTERDVIDPGESPQYFAFVNPRGS